MHKGFLILDYFSNNGNVPTKDVIQDIFDYSGVKVSERHVRRMRKEYIESLKKEEETEKRYVASRKIRKDETEMDSQQLSEKQIELINFANEGEWSIKELAERVDMKPDDVRDTLREFSFLVVGDVLDDEKEGVYFTTETSSDEEKKEEDFFTTETSSDEEKKEEDFFTTETSSDDEVLDVDFTAIDTQIQNNQDDFWEVKIETVDACSRVESEIDVFINRITRKKAMFFMKWAGRREWLAYLIGYFKDGAYYITDLYIPEQNTSSTLVHKISADKYNELNIVGVIHSHHEMGAGDADRPSFSGHDDNFINGNHNLSLLAGRDTTTKGFKIVGIARVKTPCGSLMKIKANIKAIGEELSDDEQTLKDEFMKKTQSNPPTNHIQNKQHGIHRTYNGSVVNNRTYHYTGGGNCYPANQFKNKGNNNKGNRGRFNHGCGR